MGFFIRLFGLRMAKKIFSNTYLLASIFYILTIYAIHDSRRLCSICFIKSGRYNSATIHNALAGSKKFRLAKKKLFEPLISTEWPGGIS